MHMFDYREKGAIASPFVIKLQLCSSIFLNDCYQAKHSLGNVPQVFLFLLFWEKWKTNGKEVLIYLVWKKTNPSRIRLWFFFFIYQRSVLEESLHFTAAVPKHCDSNFVSQNILLRFVKQTIICRWDLDSGIKLIAFIPSRLCSQSFTYLRLFVFVPL